MLFSTLILLFTLCLIGAKPIDVEGTSLSSRDNIPKSPSGVNKKSPEKSAKKAPKPKGKCKTKTEPKKKRNDSTEGCGSLKKANPTEVYAMAWSD